MTQLEILLAQARAWLAQDPDVETAAELGALIDAAHEGNDAHQQLAAWFAGPLQFGTAGLRGPMGPGDARMNRVSVSRAAAGLAAFLNDIKPPAGHDGHLVIVGFDARHKSDVFGRDTCEILTGVGITVAVLPHALPTPVLAFAVAHLNASAGVMVTASHNPAADNGYKVYLGPGVGTLPSAGNELQASPQSSIDGSHTDARNDSNQAVNDEAGANDGGATYCGSQIIPPHDAQIAEHIAAVGDIRELPRGDEWLTLDYGIIGDYLTRALTCIGHGSRDVRAVYTAMHGVGTEVFSRLCSMAGFSDVTPVSAQAEPNPDFPTVAFPNPEESGALDLALAEAERVSADVVIANDPDADRCAVAINDGGIWRRLTGDEVGMLLAWWLVTRSTLPTHADIRWPQQPVFASSLVSSPWLAEFAASQGIAYRETLTGFKWLAQVRGLTFGYEEALGYAVDPPGVHDKDGITAALVILELTAHLKSLGKSLAEALFDIETAHGRWFTRQVSIRVQDTSRVPTVIQHLATQPPKDLAGIPISNTDDLSQGIDGLPATDGVRWQLHDGTRIIIRPSGTEPKIKCYVASRTDTHMSDIANALTSLLG